MNASPDPAAISLQSRAQVNTWLAAQQAAQKDVPVWLELYDALLEERTDDGKDRWSWRQALYIAWAATPRNKRWPKTTKELASFLGLTSDSTIHHWRLRDPAIRQRIQELPRQALLTHIADVFDAMVTVATTPDPRANPDRQLFLKVTGFIGSNIELSGALGLDHSGQVTQHHDIDLSSLSDEHLEQLAGILDAAQHPG